MTKNHPLDYVVVPCDSCHDGYIGLQICDKCLGAGRVWLSEHPDLKRARIISWILGILTVAAAAVTAWLIVRR